MLEVILWKKLLKTIWELKKCNDGINRTEKENQRDNLIQKNIQ